MMFNSVQIPLRHFFILFDICIKKRVQINSLITSLLHQINIYCP